MSANTIAELLRAASLRVLEPDQSQSVWMSGDTEEQKLYQLLAPYFAEGSVYPDTAHAQRTYPDCVYSMSDAGASSYRGIDVAHSVVFGLSIRDTNRGDLSAKALEVAATLHAKVGVAILGRASAYEDDLQCYVLAMEVLSSVPVGYQSDNAQPFALLTLPGQELASETLYDNCGTQLKEREHHVIYHAANESDLAAQRLSVQQAIHYQQLSPSWRPITFKRGDPLPADGGLLAWVDVWRDVQRLTPSVHP